MKNLALLLFGLFLGFLVLEIGFRMIDKPKSEIKVQAGDNYNDKFFKYDEKLGWLGKKNFSTVFESSEYKTDVELNSKGFREDEISFEKDEGKYRVLFLGDSFTWGYGVEEPERFSDLIETEKVESINLSVAGYSTDQEYLLYQSEGKKYNANLVILAFFWNDMEGNTMDILGKPKPMFTLSKEGELALTNVPVPHEATPAADLNPRLSSSHSPVLKIRMWLWDHSFVYKKLITALKSNDKIFNFFKKSDLAQSEYELSFPWKLTKAIINNLRKDVENNGSEFLVLYIPLKQEVEGERRLISTRDLLRNEYSNILIDPRDNLAQSEDVYYKIDGHLTPFGHKIIADEINRRLKD